MEVESTGTPDPSIGSADFVAMATALGVELQVSVCIKPQSEVIRAIMMEDRPCCGEAPWLPLTELSNTVHSALHSEMKSHSHRCETHCHGPGWSGHLQ